MTREAHIISAIELSPLNRGLRGADWLATVGNIAIVSGADVALFDDKQDGIYEVHFLFQSRGREAIDFAREAFRQMFVEHDARLIMGLVPDFRRDVKLVARWAGGKRVGIRQTSEGPCELFVLPVEMWKATQ